MAAHSVPCLSHMLYQTPLWWRTSFLCPRCVWAYSYLRSHDVPLVTAFFFNNQVFFALMWIFFIFWGGKEWIEKKKLQKRGKVRESWEKEEGKGGYWRKKKGADVV